VVPERSSDRALEDEMVTCLSGLAAEFANVVIQDMLVVEVCSALNSFMEQQPTEEPNRGGGARLFQTKLSIILTCPECVETRYMLPVSSLFAVQVNLLESSSGCYCRLMEAMIALTSAFSLHAWGESRGTRMVARPRMHTSLTETFG